MGDWIEHDKPSNDIPHDYEWRYMTPDERSHYVLTIVFFVSWMVTAFLLRKNKYWSWMWKITIGLFVVLLFTLLADRFKNRMKEWWKEK